MSILKSPFRRSRLEVINQAEIIRDNLVSYILENFGIKSENLHTKPRIMYGSIDTTDDVRRRASMLELTKNRIDDASGKMVGYLRGANMVWPKTRHDLRVRVEYQDKALAECGRLLEEIEMLENTFDIDICKAQSLHEALIRELSLIKRWKAATSTQGGDR